MTDAAAGPVRAVRMLPPEMRLERGPGGVWYGRSPHSLGPYPRRLTERLDFWAEHAPDRVWLADRHGPDPRAWRVLTFADARARVRAVAQSLLDRGLSADRPIAMLSGNGLEHAILAYAAMYVGLPHAPIAPSYSLVAGEFTTLRALWAVLRPQLAFAARAADYDRALSAVLDGDTELVAVDASGSRFRATPFAALEASSATDAVDAAHDRVGPDTIAKILFTSGSTGAPKGVVNTQRMLCANQQMLRETMPFVADEPPVLCDWLPWNHTFGGNHNVGIALYNGGSLYIDDGRPVPGQFDATIANLREIAPTAYLNVPRGFDMLLPPLRDDVAFRRHFFSRVKMLFYAAAGLRQDVADEFDRLAVSASGERIAWVTGLGSTETAPLAMCTGAQMTSTATVGVPVPGVELKVVPVGGTMEARVRGPNVTPGYWRDDALTRAAFDEDGFYRMGDAVAFTDPAQPSRGFRLEGRLADDFKLSTGTWVRVGPLRAAFLAAAGDLVQDVVVAGEREDEVAALIFPNVAGCRRLSGVAATAPVRAVLAAPAVRVAIARVLDDFAAAHPGSSTAIVRALLLEEPPSLDAQELTDKGSINQKAVLRRRADLVARLYRDRTDDDASILRVSKGQPIS